MIRHYCDICGKQITEFNAPTGGNSIGRLGGKFKGMLFEVMIGSNQSWNCGDYCKHCIVEAVRSTLTYKTYKQD